MQIKKFKADIESFKGYQEINHNDDIDSVLESELEKLQQEEILRKQLEEEKLNMDFIEELKRQEEEEYERRRNRATTFNKPE